jgi:hypothetical protein
MHDASNPNIKQFIAPNSRIQQACLASSLLFQLKHRIDQEKKTSNDIYLFKSYIAQFCQICFLIHQISNFFMLI